VTIKSTEVIKVREIVYYVKSEYVCPKIYGFRSCSCDRIGLFEHL